VHHLSEGEALRHSQDRVGVRTVPIYTQQEIEQLRQVISRLRFSDELEAQAAAAAVSSGRCDSHLAPFWGLASTDPGLFQKLGQDCLLATYSIYGFFPGVYEMVYEREPAPTITFNGRTRGRIAIVLAEDQGLVVKPMQNQREDEIARIAGGLGVGPRQRPSLPGFLTEEFIPGRFFTELPPEEVSAEAMYRLGHTLGSMLARLHASQVFYNDAALSDPSGRSHLLVFPNGDCRFIDFGVSLLLDRHPQLSREEVYNFARTLPMFHILSRMGMDREEMGRFLDEYRQRLARTSKAEIMARDLRFTREGLSLAARRMGSYIIDPFQQGFGEAYN
jgi:tRNA A-37 threonylcarbamoyl transferase component Bud32